MHRPARLALLFALASLAACASPRAASSCRGCQAEVVVLHESPPPAPSAAPGALARAACEAVLAHNRRVLAAAPEPRPEGEVEFTKACFPVHGGAWALRLLEW